MIGDIPDLIARLKLTLPQRWFADSTPVLDGLLTGLAHNGNTLHAALITAKSQTRIATATDDFLDIISADYLGPLLPRRQDEPDQAYRVRIQRELLRERGTRHAVISVLSDLTGRVPKVFEPTRPADTGAYNGRLGYGVAGGLGSLNLPFQVFVTAYRGSGSGSGIATVSGYGQPAGGYGAGNLEYASLSMIAGEVTDAAITSAIASVMPISAIAWTRISN